MSADAAGPLEVLDEFPGASIGSWRWEGSRLLARLRPERLVHADGVTHDYSLHFVFGLRNGGGSAVTAMVSTVGELTSGGALGPGRIYASADASEEFTLSDTPAATDHFARFEWSVSLEPGEATYWSNTMWRPYDCLRPRFLELAEHAGMIPETYGESIQGRELVAYHVPTSARAAPKPLVLITSGFHPAEGDTLGTEAILEWLADEGRQERDRFDIVVVPIANPDGFALGTNGCNAAGVNFFWDFRRHDRLNCPEAFHLWNLIKAKPPVVYVDFHSYSVHGARKVPGPYVKPEQFYWGRGAKELARHLARRLDAMPGTRPQRLMAPSTLAFEITREMNTITFAKYHLHQDLGREQMKEMAVKVLGDILDVLTERSDLASELLLRPYGKLGKDTPGRLIQSAYRTRYVLLKEVRRRFQVARS